MNHSKLFDLFPSEYREFIQRYKTTLSRIFDEYEVAIFVARKALCFYKALVIGELIDKPEKCDILSDRILTYNVINRLKGKKLIVIDDVMIKGESVNKILNTLSDYGIKADVYIMARPKVGENDVLKNANIIETYAEISVDDTYQLSKHITDFIEVSVCPYNIDQPIYSFQDFNDEKVVEFVKRHNLVEISSALQLKYEIKSYILEIPNGCFLSTDLKEKIELCKIRFLYGHYGNKPVFLGIPFVLLDEMKYTELEVAFSPLTNDQLYQYINNSNKKVYYENQLKILHYCLSTQLMDAFLRICEINTFHRLNSNDDFVFAIDILQMANETNNPFYFLSEPKNDGVCYDFDFIQTEYHSLAYDFLYSSKMLHNNYFNSSGKLIESELLVLPELKEYIIRSMNGKFNALIFSIVIDTLIDRGLIIPSIVHGETKETIIRAYKCGEVYALNDKHFQLFIYTLGEYLDGIGHDRLLRTEFEKLCVLFFRESIQHDILKYKEAQGIEDEYNICYSKFGPRVSTSKPIYSANATSTLASKLINLTYLEEDQDKAIIENQEPKEGGSSHSSNYSTRYQVKKYYKLNRRIKKGATGNSDWEIIADSFAKKYKILFKSLFTTNEEKILFDEVRDMYIKTYTEFLTMLAIGKNKKDQLLSLLAELYLFNSMDINGVLPNRLCNYESIFNALISGMWKYMCYSQSNHPLIKLYEKLETDEKTEHLGQYIREIFVTNRDVDKNKLIEPLIEEAGILIFSIVYSLWFMFDKYNIIYRINNERIYLDKYYPREFYYRSFNDLRKIIKEQIQSNTREQDIQTLDSLKTKARELIERYNSEIAVVKRPINEEKNTMPNTTNTTNIYNYGTVHDGINTNYSVVNIVKFDDMAKDIIKLAKSQNLKETEALISKINDLRHELTNKTPDKKKAHAILEWMHKITSIAAAVANLYKFLAPWLGLPGVQG